MKKLVYSLVILTLCSCLYGAEITRNGKAVADIAIPDNAVSSVKFAAEELQKFIKIVSGARLDIVKESSPRKFKNRIYLGCKAAPKDKSVFVYRSKADKENVYLHGNDVEIKNPEKVNLHDKIRSWRIHSSGTLLAVYDFADRVLKMHFIRPGDDGIYAKPNKNITVKPCDKEVKPRLQYAGMSISKPIKQYGGWKDFNVGDDIIRDARLWMLRHGMVDTYWFPGKGHAFVDYWKRFGAKRPEFFALLPDGTRRPLPGNSNGRHASMCLSNPKLHNQLMWDWRHRPSRWHKGPYNILSVCENDVPVLCTCDRCRAWDGPNFKPTPDTPYWGDKKIPHASNRFEPIGVARGGEPLHTSVSDRKCRYYLEMLRKASRYNPNVVIYGHAYANHTQPPTVKLNERIMISLAITAPMPYMTDEIMNRTREIWEGWAKTGCSMEYRPNATWAWGCQPLQYTKPFATEYRMALHTPNLKRVFFDALHCEFSTQGLMYYTLVRLTQHPEKTVDEIADEFFASFGKIEPEVRAYYDYWQKVSDSITIADVNAWSARSGIRLNIFTNYEFFGHILKPEYYAESGKILAAAAKKADTPLLKRQVKYLQLGLEHARLAVRMQKARIEQLNNPSAANKKKFQQYYRELISFRNANEKYGFCDMGKRHHFESRGMTKSKPWKKIK